MNTSNFEKPLRLLTYAVFGFVVTQLNQISTADEFKLKDGRTLVGQLRGAPKKDAPQWTVELPSGTLVRFPNSQLEINGHVKTDDRVEKYKQELLKVESTAESHGALAGWCNKNGMKEQELAHYRRALDFDPDYAPARSRLGYTKDTSGRWVERDELMTEGKGKVKIGGKYFYPEVYAFNEAKKTDKEIRGKWNKLIENLQKDVVANNANSQKALAELTQINDPHAIPVLGSKLVAAKTPTNLKMIYVQMLSQSQSPDAVEALVRATLMDDEPQIRDACIDSLKRYGSDYAVASYIGALRSVSGKTQDSPESTVRLNRAAAGLNALKAENAVLPLIEALVTKFKVTRTPQSNYNPSQGLTTAGKPETTIEVSQNQDVLGALVNLTRQNFLYDKQKWLNWYASVYAAPMGDMRRDP